MSSFNLSIIRHAVVCSVAEDSRACANDLSQQQCHVSVAT